MYSYVLQNTKLSVVTSMTDLSIVVNNSLHFDTNVDTFVPKAYLKCYNILNGFCTQSPDFLIYLFKTYVRPLLEYNTIIWSPTTIKYIDK